MLVALFVVASSARAEDVTVSAARGRALFEGQESLTARIRDHDRDLPSAVVICANCHQRQAAAERLPNQAPALNRESLTTPRQRRNGPVSAYDQAAFCKLLRTGVDGRAILLARAMPLFTIDVAQCGSLWMFLTAGQAS